jgi:hypothetical protein
MTATYNDIRAAIEGRIATEMAIAPVYPVSYQNVPFTPPNNTPWLQVFLRLGDNATTLRCCLLAVLALTGRMAP